MIVFYKNRQGVAQASGDVTTYVTNLIQSKETQIQFPLKVIAVLIQFKNPICICNILVYIPNSTNLLLQYLNQIIQHLINPFFTIRGIQ